MKLHPNGWKGTASELMEACPALSEEFEVTPRALGRSLADEDIQFYLKHDRNVVIYETRSNGRRIYHISRKSPEE